MYKSLVINRLGGGYTQTRTCAYPHERFTNFKKPGACWPTCTWIKNCPEKLPGEDTNTRAILGSCEAHWTSPWSRVPFQADAIHLVHSTGARCYCVSPTFTQYYRLLQEKQARVGQYYDIIVYRDIKLSR